MLKEIQKIQRTTKMNKKKLYEAVLIAQPNWSKEESKQFFHKLREVIHQFHGKIHHIDSWGTRQLANSAQKKWSQGLYFHFSFQADPGVVTEMSRHIRMNHHLLYHHFEKLSNKLSLEDHLKAFRLVVEDSIKLEKERLARIQKRKAFMPKTGARV